MTVDPFVGRLAGEHLLLLRTVLVGERGYRQGLVLDVPRLARLAARRGARRARAAAGARFAFAPGGVFETGALGGDALAFSPRLRRALRRAARWSSRSRRCREGPASGAVLGLAGLLVVAAAAGLFAALPHGGGAPRLRAAPQQLRGGRVPRAEDAAHRDPHVRRDAARRAGAERGEAPRVLRDSRRRDRAPLAPDRQRARVLAPRARDAAPRAPRGAPRPRGARGRGAARAPTPSARASASRSTLAPGLPPVRFERDALAQILFNLVENALKYARGAADRTVESALPRRRRARPARGARPRPRRARAPPRAASSSPSTAATTSSRARPRARASASLWCAASPSGWAPVSRRATRPAAASR